MDKFLTNFAKSVALAPGPAPGRRRSSVMTVQVDLPEARKDATFSEIRGQVTKTKDPKEKVRRELYVDKTRGLATILGAKEEDLRQQMRLAGISLAGEFAGPGEPGDPTGIMFLRQADYLIRIGRYEPAMMYLMTTLEMEKENKNQTITLEALANLAKCHLLLGNWTAAKETAEKVLSVDCNHVKAIYAKAESLYNTCQFEQALMLFHRGSKIALDAEEFRLGIQKCRKTIENACKDENVFKVKGIETFFRLQQRKEDMRIGGVKGWGKGGRSAGFGKSVGGVTNVIQEQSSEARKKRQEQIKKEKDEQRKAMGAAQKLKFKAFTKKQAPEEVDTAFLSSKLMAMKGRMIGKAWTNRAAERKEIEKMQAEKPKELISETLRKARGPYKTTDPLHMCHLNSNCHRRNENSKRCGSHEMDKAEAEKKQRRVLRRCRQKAREVLSEDRLLEDKNYLYDLALGIGMRPDLGEGEEDEVEKNVSITAVQVLAFLQGREEFWYQIELQEDRHQPKHKSSKKRK